MMWRTLLAAALLLPPTAYVAGILVPEAPVPEERPALVLDEDGAGPADSERQVTIRPERDREPPSRPRDNEWDDDPDDDRDDDDDAEVVRPIPDEVDDDDADDDGDDDDSAGRDRDD